MITSTRPKPAGPPRRSRISTRQADEGAAAPSRATLDRECRRLALLCEKLREQGEEAERARGDLLGVLSHDLRNPLSVILMSTRLLGRQSQIDAPTRKLVDALTRAADEINQIAQDMSDAGRLTTGRLAVERERFDLGPLVERAIGATRSLAEPKSIRLTGEVEAALPEIAGDRERVGKVIAGLVANAVKFTPRNGAVTARAFAADGEVQIAVTDTGPGISDDQRPMLFALPRSSRARVGQGAGLSLYVAKGIVEAHGGRLWVESEPGHGSTFCLSLPVGGDDEDEEAISN